jgi:hypothetical protein
MGRDHCPDQATWQDHHQEESSAIHSLVVPHKAFDTKIPGAILPQYPVNIRKFFENRSAFYANSQPDQFQKPQTEKSSTRCCDRDTSESFVTCVFGFREAEKPFRFRWTAGTEFPA